MLNVDPTKNRDVEDVAPGNRRNVDLLIVFRGGLSTNNYTILYQNQTPLHRDPLSTINIATGLKSLDTRRTKALR